MTAGIVNVLSNDFIGNATVIRAVGNGGATGFPYPNGQTRVRIGGTGSIQNNTTVFSMHDPGTPRVDGSCNGSNIFTNMAGISEIDNPTRIVVTGIQDHNAGCMAPNEFSVSGWGSPWQ